jgi:hypothetical protein
MPNLPKFEQRLTEKIVNPTVGQASQPSYGIVLAYDMQNNTAQILLANRGSEEPGEIFNDVPCPVYAGVQSVAPEPGRPCLVIFKDNTHTYPMVTHYFNHVYNAIDYNRQNAAVNTTPRFMFNV